MQWRWAPLVFFLLTLFTVFSPAQASTAALKVLTVLPQEVLLTLPKGEGQEFQVSYTSHPMKVIIDSNLPIPDLPERQKIDDVALRELRYSQEPGGASRLVLEFNYWLPEGVVQEDEHLFQLTVPKTFVETTRRIVELGLVYGHQRRADSFGPNVVNYLEIDLRRNYEVKLVLAQDRIYGAERVSEMAKRTGALAAVNGAYFASTGRPLGVFVIDGELITEPYNNRTAVGLGPGTAVMGNVDFQGEVYHEGRLLAAVSGINRPRLQDELIIYTPAHGTKTNTNPYGHEVVVAGGVVVQVQPEGNSTIPEDGFVLSAHGEMRQYLAALNPGDRVEVSLRLEPDWREQGFSQIIGGGPRLVRAGVLDITGEEEAFKDDILKGRAPRTAIGITADDKLLLVTVNGRQPNVSVGMTLDELGNLLIELGALEAMNLDGGGSTTMVIRNLVLNLPSDGKERAVSNAIVVVAGSR
ncbi:MAG: phosphodiester glycosidase family protein [Limnochordia bacterium]|nr:phosphodiester glycosidase family protein [Limnochordia bacterium]MDI9464427.1 phosphodiester glycosidase family protein [Bacillota bacterium]NLO95028.1 phosphodiester glycosidase family protein [Bacillota bacterium]HAI52891.1 hypothetical protein [Bacillota bacterium]HAN95649.1 hypothetical protein [Bacillota bacterium]